MKNFLALIIFILSVALFTSIRINIDQDNKTHELKKDNNDKANIIKQDSAIFNDILELPVDCKEEITGIILLNRSKFNYFNILNEKTNKNEKEF